MNDYNIYAGIGGSFGKAKYQFTTLCESLEEAEKIALSIAEQDYIAYDKQDDLQIESYAILTSEDHNISPDNLILDYIIEDSNESEG